MMYRYPRPWPLSLTLLLVTTITISSAIAQGASSSGRVEVVPGQVIVRWKLPTSLRVASHVNIANVAGFRARRLRKLDTHTELLRLDTPTEAASWAAVAALENDPRVASAQPNFLRHIFSIPNDTYYAIQWYLPRVHVEGAWDITQGQAAITIAVIDTGIRKNHPDLQGQLLQGYDFISNTASSGDQDGRDPDPTDEGTNASSSSALHGTHVAGIIAARSNNGQGVAGICWDCKVLPVRVLGIKEGKGSDADIIDGIRWAAGLKVSGVPQNLHKAQIINMSFGGDGASAALTQAIQDAMAAGVIIVAAAGNQNKDAHNTYPAAIPGVITVGATGYKTHKMIAPYSNFGSVVDIMAPGGDMLDTLSTLPKLCSGNPCRAGIISTLFDTAKNEFSYHLYEGTSQAAPVVAGIVGLMLSADPTLSSKSVLDTLKKTADASYRCAQGCGAGLINAAAALQEVTDNVSPPPGDGLSFGQPCTDDKACASRVCRRPPMGSEAICTRICSAKNQCPTGSDCRSGFCAPNMDPASNTPDNEGPVVVQGIGCQVDHAGDLPLSLFFFLSLAVIIRSRRRSRAPGGPVPK